MGVTTDILKAFAAAFVSASLVNWAALPAFQSIRSRWAAKRQTEPKPEADEQKASKPSDATASDGEKSTANPVTVVASAIAGNAADSAQRELEQPGLEVRLIDTVP